MTKLFSLFIILSFVLPVSGQEKLDSDKARKEKAYHLTGSVREHHLYYKGRVGNDYYKLVPYYAGYLIASLYRR